MTQINWQPGIDFEVYGKRPPWTWVMYYQDRLLAEGVARTRIGLNWALLRQSAMFKLGFGQPAAIVRSMQ